MDFSNPTGLGLGQGGEWPVVTGLFDEDLGKNQCVIADESGRIAATYDKQHPGGIREPKGIVRMPPAVLDRDPFPVSGASTSTTPT